MCRLDLPKKTEKFAIDQISHGLKVSTQWLSPYDHHEVRALLSLMFPDRWIDKEGIIAWPPMSPDFTYVLFL